MEQELEFILRDMLDDLRSLKTNNAQQQKNSIEVINTLNGLEKLLKEQMSNFPVVDTKSVEDIIRKELFQLRNSISNETLNKRIEHKHHLHRGLVISLALFLICIVLSFGWYNCYDVSKQIKANDIKYRALKVIGGKSLLRLLHDTDSLYSVNNNLFERKIEEKEEMKRFNR